MAEKLVEKPLTKPELETAVRQILIDKGYKPEQAARIVNTVKTADDVRKSIVNIPTGYNLRESDYRAAWELLRGNEPRTRDDLATATFLFRGPNIGPPSVLAAVPEKVEVKATVYLVTANDTTYTVKMAKPLSQTNRASLVNFINGSQTGNSILSIEPKVSVDAFSMEVLKDKEATISKQAYR